MPCHAVAYKTIEEITQKALRVDEQQTKKIQIQIFFIGNAFAVQRNAFCREELKVLIFFEKTKEILNPIRFSGNACQIERSRMKANNENT